jgi:pimeloyl-ACP methyl ester carboxylesterase
MRLGSLALLVLANTLAGCAMPGKQLSTYSEFIGGPCDSADITLYSEEYGEGDPILFMHGLGMSSFTWRHLSESLARGHRVILVDLKGFGNSPKPSDDQYTIYDQARLICRSISDHDLTNLTLVGNSLGGGVALATALYLSAHAPERLKRLILIDTIAYAQEMPLFVKLLAMPVLGPLVVATVPKNLQVRTIMRLAYFDDEAVPGEAVDRYADVLNKPGAQQALVQTARQIIPADLDRLTARYSEISSPTLILWGQQDAIVPLDIGRRLHGAIPDSQLVILPDTGHIPQEERPEATLAAIKAFISRN